MKTEQVRVSLRADLVKRLRIIAIKNGRSFSQEVDDRLYASLKGERWTWTPTAEQAAALQALGEQLNKKGKK